MNDNHRINNNVVDEKISIIKRPSDRNNLDDPKESTKFNSITGISASHRLKGDKPNE